MAAYCRSRNYAVARTLYVSQQHRQTITFVEVPDAKHGAVLTGVTKSADLISTHTHHVTAAPTLVGVFVGCIGACGGITEFSHGASVSLSLAVAPQTLLQILLHAGNTRQAKPQSPHHRTRKVPVVVPYEEIPKHITPQSHSHGQVSVMRTTTDSAVL